MTDQTKTVQPDDIGCLQAIEMLYAYLDGELGDEEAIARVEKHLGHCRSCYSRTQMERVLTQHIRSANRQTVPDALQSRLRKLMDDFD